MVAALERLGGVGSARQIVALTSRRKLRLAMASGEIRRCRRGLYMLEKYEHTADERWSWRRSRPSHDERRRIVIEADSFEFHTSQEAHARDCVRYTATTVDGWLVLRFTWHQVMHSPAYVRAVLADMIERTDRRAMPPGGLLDSA